eukprot:4926147-Pleurochrysis_carterae.AAC.1
MAAAEEHVEGAKCVFRERGCPYAQPGLTHSLVCAHDSAYGATWRCEAKGSLYPVVQLASCVSRSMCVFSSGQQPSWSA